MLLWTPVPCLPQRLSFKIGKLRSREQGQLLAPRSTQWLHQKQGLSLRSDPSQVPTSSPPGDIHTGRPLGASLNPCSVPPPGVLEPLRCGPTGVLGFCVVARPVLLCPGEGEPAAGQEHGGWNPGLGVAPAEALTDDAQLGVLATPLLRSGSLSETWMLPRPRTASPQKCLSTGKTTTSSR